MPRKARIDYPGALNHIMVRGIERRHIFLNDLDKICFIKRLAKVLLKTNTTCYAWVIMSNHVHLLLETGDAPISKVMHSLLTSYAIYYNKHYNRVGYLYQNRFKSVLCDKNEYFLELIRYIHLNPIRAKQVTNLTKLEYYFGCGHQTILGKTVIPWQNREIVLHQFSSSEDRAIQLYLQFLHDGLSKEKSLDLSGGGLIRSYEGEWEKIRLKHDNTRIKGDERILGKSDFLGTVLKYNEENRKNTSISTTGINRLITEVTAANNIDIKILFSKQRTQALSHIRKIICRKLFNDHAISQTELAKLFQITPQAISKYLKN